MHRLQVAAHFAAFVCFLNQRADVSPTPNEAGKFARNNWDSFLPCVDEDLGRILTAKTVLPRQKKPR